MSDLVESLADLTATRDRAVLDVALVTALRDVLNAQVVSVHRRVGETDRERWLVRARLRRGDVAAVGDAASSELDVLPRLVDRPHHHRALFGRGVVHVDLDSAAGDDRGRHLALFPLLTEAGPVGVVEVETVRPLEPVQRQLVDSILRLHCNFESLLDDSERDALTGLRNRKTYDREFMKLTTEPVPSSGEPAGADAGARTWLGLIDIDHFKCVNDTHGHQIGDEVLLLLSRVMRSSFRLNDHLFRFGGEEFVVLMRCADEAHAMASLERLRSAVASQAFPRVGHVTISIGLSAVRPGEPPSAAFQRADLAVYWAKAHGRNRVACHADLLARRELHEACEAVGDVELF